jgi:UDP-N-acetylmuramate--alanine ligase
LVPDPAYYGGTTTRQVTSGDIIAGVAAKGHDTHHIPDRTACDDKLLALAKPGDRIVIMGARDDTLSEFAAGLLARLALPR